MSGANQAAVKQIARARAEQSSQIVRQRSANELFFAVVSPVGAGSSLVARQLMKSVLDTKFEGKNFTCAIIKAGDVIKEWAAEQDKSIPANLSALDRKVVMQAWGDEMRRPDRGAVAVRMVEKIAKQRADFQKKKYLPDQEAIRPDGAPRAYILDSLKHPEEVNLLRRLYGSAFVLIGVVCSRPQREDRLLGAFFSRADEMKPSNRKNVQEFISRDENDAEHPWGQHVADTFHEADFFIDNTVTIKAPETGDMRDAVADHIIPECNRLISILTHGKIERPTIDETAMHVAYSAKLRSSCLSRQVGAALVDRSGNVIATGTNEVPKAGGGVYGEKGYPPVENRCAYCGNMQTKAYCSNNKYQNDLIDDAITALYGKEITTEERQSKLSILRKTKIGALLEFSRSVHAEMDAILSAARSGANPLGARLFVTTFPCHYCARHIVSAGIYEVQYIEPYPKSLALELHRDAIETVPEVWIPPREISFYEEVMERASPSKNGKTPKPILVGEVPEGTGKVLFKPFVGVAPRFYPQVFLKDRDYKNKISGIYEMGETRWGSPWSQHQISYAVLEKELINPPAT